MKPVSNIVIWLCKKFNRTQLEFIVSKLQKVLEDKKSDLQPKDDFKEQHPNYRKFDVDPLKALEKPPKGKRKLKKNWKKLQKKLEKKTAGGSNR